MTFEAFTVPNIKRKPALPIIEMLERSKRFAITNVRAEVISKPSTGLFEDYRYVTEIVELMDKGYYSEDMHSLTRELLK